MFDEPVCRFTSKEGEGGDGREHGRAGSGNSHPATERLHPVP